MIRASWSGGLLSVLVSVSVAAAQPPDFPDPLAAESQPTVTLQQGHGRPEVCRLKKAWKTENGRQAWLLQSIDSDMLLTVVQRARGPAGSKQVGVHIYPWGNSSEPPPGSPIPPPDGDVRRASYTVPTPDAQTMPGPALVEPASPVGYKAAACDKCKPRCEYVHQFETPPVIQFQPGHCLPVCCPDHSPGYGYYPTQWRPFAGSPVP
jgi:hypothetical protein